jgi:glycine/D-amino acid oxidase-like deaminating enzyme
MVPAAPVTTGYRSGPYWWDGVEVRAPRPAPLPEATDVAVIGGGYTGLGAALELARRGHSVAVLERDDIAAGASSRNGGMVHPGGKPSLPEFLALPGGRSLWDDTVLAVESLVALCADLGIDCEWRRSGHLELAHHPRAADALRAVAAAYDAIGEEARFVDRAELGAEIGSDRFAGGLLVARSGGLHPAKLATGLVQATATAGAQLHGQCTVFRVERAGAGYLVETSRGTVRCGQVAMATNGTTGTDLVPWLGRRVLGIGSYMIATEPLEPGVAESISPRGRMFFDTRNFLHYWRLSPDGSRLLFGGRTSLSPTTVEQARDRLYAAMVAIHPQLSGARVERAWGGQVALTADRLPHTGRDGSTGVAYAMGYCGSGVALSLHLGRALGRRLAGADEPAPFARRRWPPVPWPARIPWLLPVGGWWYRGRDVVGR